ncbi:MAG: hypothetical protein N3E49_06830 [Bacteroidia bacterium]|nr:hypothetical protein [Bacteroidia bacterium]
MKVPSSLPRLWHRIAWRSQVALRSTWTVLEGLITLSLRPAITKEGEGFLFIRLDGLGDFWLWLPFVAALRKAHPEKPFYLVANDLWADLALWTGLFDKVIPVQPVRLRRSFRYRRALLSELHRRIPPVEVLWQTTFTRRIVAEDWLAWNLPASKRIAWARDYHAAEPAILSYCIDKSLYRKVRRDPLPPLAHEWSRYHAWLQELEFPGLDWAIYTSLRDRLYRPSSSYAVALVGAGSPGRIPPVDLLRVLIEYVHRSTSFPVRLIGTAADRSRVASLIRPGVEDWLGKLTLREAAEQIRNAVLVVGLETGLGHIAATLGVPTLMMAGGGHWGRFIPYPPEVAFPLKVITYEMPCFGCGWMCQYQFSRSRTYPCIAQIPSHQAVESALSWIKALVRK